MAHKGSIVSTIEDITTGLPKLLRACVDGVTAAASEFGSIGFAFKDSSGKVVLPQLNGEGSIPVSFDNGIPHSPDAGTATGNKTTEQVVVTHPIALLKKYNSFSVNGSCFRDAIFRLVHIDDVGVGDTETELGLFLVSPGDVNCHWIGGKKELDTTAGTGIQAIELRAINTDKESDFVGDFSFNEIVP